MKLDRIRLTRAKREAQVDSEPSIKNITIMEGWEARKNNRNSNSCPYSTVDMAQRNAWLYGWHECNKELMK
jgi:ribosome modulation factor